MYTKSWICGFITLLFIFWQTQAQRNDLDLQLCKRQQDLCQAGAARLGNTDVGVNAVNAQCRVIRGPSWKNITRCQLIKASCELTLIRCTRWDCKNIEKALQ